MPQPKRETPIQPEATPGSATQETPPPPTAATAKRWYQGWGNRLTLATLILPLLWPIAPLIIWIYSSWSKKAKIILTIIVLLLSLPLIELAPTLTQYAYQGLFCRPSQITPPADMTQGIYGRFTATDDVQSPFRCTTRPAPESVIVLKKQSVETLLIAKPGEREDPIPLAQLFRFLTTEELERAAIRKTVASGGRYALALEPGDYILCGKFYAGYSCTQVRINEDQKARIDLNQAWGRLHIDCQDTECQTSIQIVTDTANWKTYTNESLGITFKYPSSWYGVETSNLSTRTLISFKDGRESVDLPVRLEITSGYYYNQELKRNLTLHEWISKQEFPPEA